MKPHEEEWHKHPSSAGYWVTVGRDGPIVLTVSDGPTSRGDLALAAPDMARALIMMLDHGSRGDVTYLEARNAARAALAKAGVLPSSSTAT